MSCCREPMTLSNDRFSRLEVSVFVFFSAAVHLSGGRWNLPSALACPLHSSCSYRSSRREEEVEAASCEGVTEFVKMQISSSEFKIWRLQELWFPPC